jgi:hypothetical protein
MGGFSLATGFEPATSERSERGRWFVVGQTLAEASFEKVWPEKHEVRYPVPGAKHKYYTQYHFYGMLCFMFELELGKVKSLSEITDTEASVIVLDESGEETDELLNFDSNKGDFVVYDYDENSIEFALGFLDGSRTLPPPPKVGEQIAFERDYEDTTRIRVWCPSANWLAQVAIRDNPSHYPFSNFDEEEYRV